MYLTWRTKVPEKITGKSSKNSPLLKVNQPYGPALKYEVKNNSRFVSL